MQSALAGFVVLVLAVWVKYVFNRLWQKTLLASSEDALVALQAQGFEVQPLGFGPVVVARGTHNGEPVRLEWRGSWKGETSRVRVGGRVLKTPLIRTQAQVAALLSGEE